MYRVNNQTSILSYWTFRYLIILCIGLLLIASASLWGIRQVSMENRMQTAGLLAQEIADRVAGPDGAIHISPDLEDLFENRKRFFKLNVGMCLIVMDNDGTLLFSIPKLTQSEMEHKLNDDLSDASSPDFRAAVVPIEHEGEQIGQVALLQPKKALMHISSEAKLFLAVMLISVTGLGWLTIYLLSRKLSRPIRRIMTAAKQISEGRYDIRLETDAKEREINELLISFKDMAGRLKQLEHSRAVMLAGVSHELKTPVTSIKALVHAVREEVVNGEEAGEFLDTALKETERLQRMVADLLDYNSLAAGIVHIHHDRLAAVPLISEIVYQWKLVQGDEVAEPELCLPDKPFDLAGDPLRIQQIIVNLLNNCLHARHPARTLSIQVELSARDDGMAEIAVTDNGTGIKPEDRELVFERFFRGDNNRCRGLGLGLTFSLLLARSMGGNLALRDSSEEGSTFVLTLPVQR
ncbi:ATP-binding protein [Paenibacillus tarimensis]